MVLWFFVIFAFTSKIPTLKKECGAQRHPARRARRVFLYVVGIFLLFATPRSAALVGFALKQKAKQKSPRAPHSPSVSYRPGDGSYLLATMPNGRLVRSAQANLPISGVPGGRSVACAATARSLEAWWHRVPQCCNFDARWWMSSTSPMVATHHM